MRKRIFLLLPLGLIWSLGVRAQPAETPELESDRPNKTQGARVVPWRTIQLETGVQLERDRKSNLTQREFLYPEVLLRIGLLKRAELRFNAEYKKQILDLSGSPDFEARLDTKGWNNVQLGTKVFLAESEGIRPEIGFLAQVTLPLGDPGFRPSHVLPEGILLFNHKISEQFSLQYNTGYRRRMEEEENRGEGLYSVSANWKLHPKIEYFAEVFGHKTRQDRAENSVDTGFLIDVRPNLRFDLVGGVGLSQAAPDFFAGTGLTWRLPQ